MSVGIAEEHTIWDNARTPATKLQHPHEQRHKQKLRLLGIRDGQQALCGILAVNASCKRGIGEAKRVSVLVRVAGRKAVPPFDFRLINTVCISSGGISETAVDVRQIIKHAVLCNATVLALTHNHPSNNPKPSSDDDRITQRVKSACDIMRIHFLDHVIVTDGQYYSYQEQGRI